MTRTSIEATHPPDRTAAGRPGLDPGPSAIAVPWGPDGTLDLRWPAAGPLAGAAVEVVGPDLSGPVADYPAALEAALDAPVGRAAARGPGRAGPTVAIVVDDPSRWTPVREALPIVLGRLHAAGVRPEDVTISVGVGRHHAVDAEAMRGGSATRSRTAIAASARRWTTSRPTSTWATPEGVPVRVFRPVAEADLRILIGSVLPHLQAGFGGGYKLIFPGTSHRSTLGALHRQGLGRRADAGRPARRRRGRATRCGGRSARRPACSARASRSATCSARPGRSSAWSPAIPTRSRTGSRPRPGGGSGPPRRRAGRPGRRGQPSLAGRPDAELQGAAPAPRGLPARRRAGRLLLDRPRRDRPLVPASAALRRSPPPGALGGWAHPRGLVPAAQHAAALAGSPAAFMIRWARELVVDRTVLVYAPPLRDRIGPRLGPSASSPIRMSSGRSGRPGPVIGQRTATTGKHRVRSRFASASSRRAD